MGPLLIICLMALVCYIVYKHCFQPFKLFKEYSIPCLKPVPFFGNYLEMKRMGFIPFLNNLNKLHGPISGFYVGKHPFILVSDAEALKQIFIRNSGQFLDRESMPDFSYKAVGLPPGLFMEKGDQWKKSRRSISPAFSSLNLRMVANWVESISDKLLNELALSEDMNESVHIDKLYASFTMECILAMMFGESANLPNNEKSRLSDAAKELFTAADEANITLLYCLLSHFPQSEYLIGFALKHTWRGYYFRDISEICTKIVQSYSKVKEVKTKSILQIMTEAEIKDCCNGGVRKMSVKEIVSHAITFLMAGYETTALSLAYTSLLLALNPEVQEKLHKEIEDYYKLKPDASLFDAAQEIEYVGMVVLESMRIYPPAPGTTRHCAKKTTINGVTIPGGVTIFVPIIQLQNSKDYWQNPEKFIPERFSAEEKAKHPKLVYLPFGAGPRSCIGSKLAILEQKIMLVNVLRSYKFLPVPGIKVPLETTYRLTMPPKNGIHLLVAKW